MNCHPAKSMIIALALSGSVAIQLAAEPNPPPTQDRPETASAEEMQQATRDAEREARREALRAKRESELEQVWSSLSIEEKAQMIRLFQGVKELPKEEAKTLQDGINKFMRLPPDVREATRSNYKIWTNMTKEQRDAARDQYRLLKREFEANWKKNHPGEEIPQFPFRVDKQGKVVQPEVQPEAAPTDQTKK